ncbi:flippase [Flavobacterium sp. 3HN19-14]|uniref:flippase n=1 Tax=Flavobacterium sp. 3HN19-14 TaxID=3448133 RepID=UPI003EE399FB
MNLLSDSFKKIISSSGVNFIFRIFGLGTSFLTTIIITRLFGVGTYGNYALIFTIAQATAIIFTLGIPNTLIKIIGNHNFSHKKAKKLLIKGLKAALAISLIPMLFFYFGASMLSEDVFNSPKLINYFLIVTIALPLFVVHEIFLYFLIATKNFMKYNFFMFIVPNVLLIAFLVIFYYADKTGAFTFLAFAMAILLTVLMEAFTIFEIKPDKEQIPFTTLALLKTASPLMFSGLFLYLLNWTDVIILGMMVEDKQIGIYNIAYKVGSVGFLVIVSISTIITPRIAELYGEKNMTELKKLVHNSTRLIAVLSVPIVVVLIFMRGYILSFFGTEAIAGGNTLIIVSLGVLFSAMAGNVDQILNMTNNQGVLRNITIICFFINAALNLALIPQYGIEGSAFASLLTNVLLNFVCVYYVKKRLGFYTLF